MASIKNLEIELNDKLVKRITELEQENERLRGGVRIALNQLKMFDCFQGCNGGVIQESEDECYQCQWCGEQDVLKALIKTKDNQQNK